jgi:hypothetical protein
MAISVISRAAFLRGVHGSVKHRHCEPVELLGDEAELNDEVGGQPTSPRFSCQRRIGAFVLAHDDPGVGAANEVAAVKTSFTTGRSLLH